MDSGELNYRTVNGRVKTGNVMLLATPINCCGTGGLNGWQPPEPPGVQDEAIVIEAYGGAGIYRVPVFDKGLVGQSQ